MFAAEQQKSGLAKILLEHIFNDRDENGDYYQVVFGEDYSEKQVLQLIEAWLLEAGLDQKAFEEVKTIANYPEIADKMSENHNIVMNQLKAKGIPTMIYDGKRHTGIFKSE